MTPKGRPNNSSLVYVWDGTENKPVAWTGDITIAGNLIDVDYDYVAVTYPLGTTEVFTFKAGGAGGSTVATVTIVYTDATKTFLSTIAKT